MTSPASPSAFEQEMRRCITALAGGAAIRRNTPLFDYGLIDSMRVLDLIVRIEELIGRRLRDEEITLQSFRTLAAISRTFGSGTDVERMRA